MKSSLFLAAFIMLCVAACGKSEKAAETASSTDSTNTTAVDSIALQAPDTVAVEVNPEEALTLTVEKKNLYFVPESSYKAGSWTVKVTNNSTSPVSGTDYVVAYTEIVEVGTAEGFSDVSKKRTAQGQDVAPGESVYIKLKAKHGCQEFKSPRIKSIK